MGIESPKNHTEDADMEFHEHIKKLRESKELTQIQVAEAVGVAKNTYIGYEKGSREPRLNELKKLAELFGVSLGELCLESRDSGLSGMLKASFEATKDLRARDKAALLQVINGYVAARRIAQIQSSYNDVPEDIREELIRDEHLRNSEDRLLQEQEDRELDELIKLETAIEEHEAQNE
ncbi:helix-turn-helix transcriptional regulator [Spongiibacter marinus]|uniref:helix-turn-helix transcriptional regulator n=1 Tax=Spongiibacter marinus TaxID=354246 RepID=UPI0035640644